MDLALNNPQRLIYHKTQQTNQYYYSLFICLLTVDAKGNEPILMELGM